MSEFTDDRPEIEKDSIEEVLIEEQPKEPKKRNKLVEKLTAKGPQIDFKCPACGTVFKATISVKFKIYTCPECKAEYNLRPSAPQPHGGKEE